MLIKENHITVAGSLANAVRGVRSRIGHLAKVEVEVETLDQLREAVREKVDIVMLDNMSFETACEAMKIVDGRIMVEVSGGLTGEDAEKYAAIGVDTDTVLEKLSQIKVSLQCWQGDDVLGFMFPDQALTGGISVSGNYPGKATTPAQLRADLDKALSLIPGNHKVNLHAIYVDTDKKIDLDQIEPKHYEKWVQWAKEKGLGHCPAMTLKHKRSGSNT